MTRSSPWAANPRLFDLIMKPFTVSSTSTPCPPLPPLAPFGLRSSDFGLRPSGLRRLTLWCALLFALALHRSAAAAADRQVVPGHVPPAVARLQPLNRLPASQRLTLAIGLPLRNQAQLTAFLQALYDPASPNYGSYLTPQQFTNRFGPSQQDYQALIDFAKANNLRVTATSPNRLILNVDGAAADIEKALHLALYLYQHPTEPRTFYAPDTEPSLDLPISILHVKGLNNYFLPKPAFIRRPANATPPWAPALGSGPNGTYLGNDFRAAYIPGTSLTGAFETVGLLQLDGYFASDIASYESMAGLPNVPLQNVLLDGFNGVPGFNNGEVCLDIEMCVSMAPGLSQILVYEAPNGYPTAPDDILNQMANDNLASQLSSSWLIGDDPIADQIYRQFAAQGQSFFQCSGDNCSFYPGSQLQYADDPYITLVGGTTLSTTGPGGGYTSETVWNWGQGEGSGGGISTNYAIPVWQQGVNMSTNGGSTTMRNVPDVALTADNIFTISDNGAGGAVGGTSAATPLWAAFTALINQQALENGEAPVGFLNPALYAIAKSQLYAGAFHDITTGNNTNLVNTNLFYAFPGYDLCTGWGSPNGTNIVNLLAPPIGQVPLLSYVTNYISGGNGNGAIDPNECNNLNVVLTNFGGVSATGVRATLSSPTPGVIVVQPVSLYGTILTNSAATNLVPFKVSTAPTFPCGTPVVFILTVTSDQAVRQVSPRFQLSTGVPGVPLRYDNSSDFAIPDLGQVDSPVVVSNFPSAVTKATVSLFATDTYDSGLVFELIAPGGARTTLSANNGGSGQNYGQGCAPDDARTTFDDDAPAPISTAFAPFVGTFRPDNPLSVFIGRAGTNVNGVWKLRALDQYPQNTGVLHCWSLFLTPAACLDGGGECPGADMAIAMSAAPDPVIIGDLLTYTISVTNNGPSSTKTTVVTQPIPSGVQFVTAAPSQGSWSFLGGIVTFVLGSMPARSTASITVTCQAIVPGDFPSTATVTSDQLDPNPANNTATVLIHVLPPTSDLAVSISAFPNAPVVGGTLTYTVTAVNNGPSPASGVVLTNVLPDNAALLSAIVSQGSAAINGNAVVCGFGTLVNAASATATITVTTLAQGVAVDTASISGDQYDPSLANNTATLKTAVGPAADLSVTVIPSQNPVVLFSNLTYFITVSNAGPSTATSVVLSHTLDPSLSFVSMTSSQGAISRSGNTITANIGTLAGGVSALVTVQVIPTIQGPAHTLSSVAGAQSDPDQSDNSVTTSVQVAPPFISILPAGATLISESFSPPDGAIDNGETVTVSLRLRNTGNVSNTNLQATLLATNGVTPVSPNNPQDYGILPPGSSFAAQQFSFTASGAPGATISAVLQLQDGPNLLTNTVAYNFTLPTILTFANTNVIAILDDTSAAPYPSTINVSGLTGTLSKVTATLSGFSHTYPRDVDVLLVAPTRANTLLMSHAANQPADNLDLTFDDDASSPMPRFGSLSSGAYQPTAFSPAPVFSNPAPAGPYTAVLSSLNGINPNGLWSLFVEDDRGGDFGAISNGWSLTLTAVTPVNPLADLALLAFAPPSTDLVSDNLTYSFVVTNGGPNSASNIIFTNVLPANVVFVSASCSQGNIGLSGNAVIGNLGSINAGSTTAVAVVFAPTPAAKGALVNTAGVGATEIDLNPANNIASTTINLVLPVADLAVSQTFAPNPVVVGYPLTNTIAITNVGTGMAIDVVLTNMLPTNTAFVSATSTAGSCTANGGLLTCALGNLGPDAGASVSLILTPLLVAPVTSVTVASTASADLAVSQTFAPPPPVVGYLTNTIAITNGGPGVAIGVVLTDLWPTNTAFVSATSTAGSCATNNGLLTCDLGNLGPDAGASVSLILTQMVVAPLTSVPVATAVSTVPDRSSISVTNSVAVNGPAPFLLAAGAVLLPGSGPGNGSVNPGQTVTVSLYLTNAGTADTTTNLTATLLDSGGVAPGPNAQEVYGVIVHAGPVVARPFTFTAVSFRPATTSQGGSITATLLLQDVQTLDNGLQVTNYVTTNSFLFILPAPATFSSQQSIAIPTYGQGTPYPSTLPVSGITGVVSEATVTFSGLSHTFPSDINALLVSPAGTNVLLMAHAGANNSISNVTLFFEDTGAPLPQASQITNGAYQPTAYNARTLPSPAPPGPYASILANLNGWNPNGTWSLYVLDDKPGDSGLLNGWDLILTIVNPLNPVCSDVGLAASAPSVVLPGSNLTYSVSIFNRGPSTAAGVTLTDPLPDGVSFESALSSQGTYSLGDGLVTFNLGALSVGASATASLSVVPRHYGLLTNTLTVASQETDLNPANNSAQSVTAVLGLSIRPVLNGQYQLTVASAPGQTYVIQSSSDLSSWTPVSTNTAGAGSPIVFPVSPQSASHAFYRVVLAAP